MTAVARLSGHRLVAVSDLHADAEALRTALVVGGLCQEEPAGLRWVAPAGTVLAVVGDFIDGPTGAAGLWRVVEGLRRLQGVAAAAGSSVVVLLGNHETDLLGGAWSLCGGRAQLAASLHTSTGPSASWAWMRACPIVAVVRAPGSGDPGPGAVLVHGGPTPEWERWAQHFGDAERALVALVEEEGLRHPLLGSGPESLLSAAPRGGLPFFYADPALRRRFVRGWGVDGPLLVGHHAGIAPAPGLVPLDGGLRHGSGRVRIADLDVRTGEVVVVEPARAVAA